MKESGSSVVELRLELTRLIGGRAGPSSIAYYYDAHGHVIQTRRRIFNREQLIETTRRTIATLGQKKGTPKDIQGVLRHSRLSTTTDVYMQEIPESVKVTVAAINKELRLKPQTAEAS